MSINPKPSMHSGTRERSLGEAIGTLAVGQLMFVAFLLGAARLTLQVVAEFGLPAPSRLAVAGAWCVWGLMRLNLANEKEESFIDSFARMLTLALTPWFIMLALLLFKWIG